jgi:hypothetical protein
MESAVLFMRSFFAIIMQCVVHRPSVNYNDDDGDVNGESEFAWPCSVESMAVDLFRLLRKLCSFELTFSSKYFKLQFGNVQGPQPDV